MPFVTNLSMTDVIHGRFPDWVNSNTILIQIQDVDYSPTARFANVKRRSKFSSVYQFRFDDTTYEIGPDADGNAITDDQAQSIANILKNAYDKGKNVVVHCHAGVCQSGAVTEVAVMYGFTDVNKNTRIPNTLVKEKVCKHLDLKYSLE